MYHFQQQTLPVLAGNSPDCPGLVHCLDKDTSGIMVVAKTDLAMQQFHRGVSTATKIPLILHEKDVAMSPSSRV